MGLRALLPCLLPGDREDPFEQPSAHVTSKLAGSTCISGARNRPATRNSLDNDEQLSSAELTSLGLVGLLGATRLAGLVSAGENHATFRALLRDRPCVLKFEVGASSLVATAIASAPAHPHICRAAAVVLSLTEADLEPSSHCGALAASHSRCDERSADWEAPNSSSVDVRSLPSSPVSRSAPAQPGAGALVARPLSLRLLRFVSAAGCREGNATRPLEVLPFKSPVDGPVAALRQSNAGTDASSDGSAAAAARSQGQPRSPSKGLPRLPDGLTLACGGATSPPASASRGFPVASGATSRQRPWSATIPRPGTPDIAALDAPPLPPASNGGGSRPLSCLGLVCEAPRPQSCSLDSQLWAAASPTAGGGAGAGPEMQLLSRSEGVALVLQWLRSIGARPGGELCVVVSEWCDDGNLQQLMLPPRRAPSRDAPPPPPSRAQSCSPGTASGTADGFLIWSPSTDLSLGPAPMCLSAPHVTAASRPATSAGAVAAAAAPSAGPIQKWLQRRAARIAALRCAVQIAEALAALHAAGLHVPELNPTSVLCCRLPAPAAAGAATACAAGPLEALISAAPLGRALCKLAACGLAWPSKDEAENESNQPNRAAHSSPAVLRRPAGGTRGPGSHASSHRSANLSLNTSEWGAMAYVPPEVLTGGWIPPHCASPTAAPAAPAFPELASARATPGPAPFAPATPGPLARFSAMASSPTSGSGANLGPSIMARASMGSDANRCTGEVTFAAELTSSVVGERLSAETTSTLQGPMVTLRMADLDACVEEERGKAQNAKAQAAAVAAAAGNAYSFGVMLWQLLMGRTPHYDLHPAQIMVGKATGLDMSLPWDEVEQEDLQRLGASLVATNPAARPSLRAAADALAGALRLLTTEAAAAAEAVSHATC
ncbi:hypothetical protein HYH03_010922 [Edaphochlamys debaryana]|uniref:Protein kinase domain-containing protein n=1 Tax=Edaphochlamys debaryana TaxID=47281 RepID=A0A835XT78_9CHLO|nr:hypothetical protein HYH03_010922 [Edaphochlamys debaryana]|eukprot:KAG2490772.1 hypothetical protein HYH03_010922 [Edaphochlamys debaryana]